MSGTFGSHAGEVACRAMVLAAGLGTRLRPLTDLLPKPLVPLLDRPLILANLLLLRAAGVREVLINLHYRGEALRRQLGDGQSWGLDLRYSEEPTLLGTGGGVRRVLDWLGERGTFLLLNGDTVVDVDLAAALQRHRQRRAEATMLLHHHPEAALLGAVGLSGEGRVEAIGPLLGPRPDSPYLFAGVHIVEPGLLEPLSPAEPSCIIRQGYVPALKRGARIFGDPCVRYWADLGTPARYLEAQLQLLRQPGLLGHLRGNHVRPAAPEGMQVIEPVWLGEGVKLEGTAVVGPEVVLGRGAVLGDRARLKHCVVWPGTRAAGELQRGILLEEGRWLGLEEQDG